MITEVLIKLIKAYQRTLSPDHGLLRVYHPYGFCRFYPSCSEYSKQALQTHGLFKGVLLSLKRILKCNPFAKSDFDRVPQK